jgi:hypothetical protein
MLGKGIIKEGRVISMKLPRAKFTRKVRIEASSTWPLL